jgi:transposase
MPGKDISEENRTRVSTLLDTKIYSYRQIEEMTGVSKSTISRINKKKQLGEEHSLQRTRRCGRFRATTVYEDRILIRYLKKRPLSTAKQLNIFWRKAGVYVTTRTIQNRLRELGIKSRSVIKKPALTKAMIAKRYQFAKYHQNWLVDDWKNVIFL